GADATELRRPQEATLSLGAGWRPDLAAALATPVAARPGRALDRRSANPLSAGQRAVVWRRFDVLLHPAAARDGAVHRDASSAADTPVDRCRPRPSHRFPCHRAPARRMRDEAPDAVQLARREPRHPGAAPAALARPQRALRW